MAVLNAAAAQWFVIRTAATSGTGTTRWKKIYVERLPVPAASEDKQALLVDLVDQIIDLVKNDPDTDVSQLEAEIDKEVFKLYGLTKAEIKAVKDSVGS